MKIKAISVIVIICICFKAKAQDPIFTQFFMVPESLNPGFSGFEKAHYAGIMHRTQWPSLDLQVDTEYGFYNTWLDITEGGVGIGGSILNQLETNSGYRLTQANANFAYIISLENGWSFRPAIEVGYGNKSFNFKNLILSDQINIDSGVINNTSIDPLALDGRRDIWFWDFSTGFVFDKEGKNGTDFWIGASIKHLTRPDISLTGNNNAPLDIFYSLHANYKFTYFDDYDIYFSANYMKQGNYSRLDTGATFKIDERLFLGAMMVGNLTKNNGNGNNHLLTSVNTFAGFEFKHWRFGFSYDINTTNIGRTDGVYELSLTYMSRCFHCNDERKK